ncbi:MAG TPA: hypothetical protein PLM05_05370, partial [Bacteroidales bacterium]|nr:hypothetical protein [Bacteroidales bacterium]HOR09416.1 hypothetical protein [Bacteroidales bacterium]
RLDYWRQRTVDRSDEHQSDTDQHYKRFCHGYLYSNATVRYLYGSDLYGYGYRQPHPGAE